MQEVDNMTPEEYRLLIKARKLKEVDEMYKIHVQAFANHRVKATKGKKQKPVYRRFNDFFNYEREIKKALGIKNKKIEGISKIMKERRVNNG